MALDMPAPPPTAVAAVTQHFDELARTGAFRLPALRRATGTLRLAQPHEVFTLGLDDLVAGRGLAAAKPTGWRHLVQEGDKPLALAETHHTAATGGHVFSGFNEGRFVASTAEAIRMATALPAVAQGRFELRVLDVPGLYVRALWLHAPAGTGDLLVPLAPSPVATPAGRPVPAAVLLTELAAKAQGPGSVGPSDPTGG